jgi:hypothetical protein
MTDPTVDLFATEVAGLASLYGPEVDELALLVAGEPEEKVRDVLETLAEQRLIDRASRNLF